jgi:hypothetical protein
MSLTAAQTRTALADRTANPARTVAPAVGRNTGGQTVHLSLVYQGVQFKAEDVYDAIAAKYGTAASLTTALTGANNDLTYTARVAGLASESVTVRYVDPGAASAALSVAVVGQAITVNLATNGSSVITSTAAQVRDAINGSAAASALVFAANAAANDGTGVVTALAATPLAGSGGKVFTDRDAPSHENYQLRITP